MVERFRRARRDDSLVVLEGFHSLKHALRFGATILETVSPNPAGLSELARSLAPELVYPITELVTEAPEAVFRQLSPVPPATGVISLARRPHPEISTLTKSAPLVLLETPRGHGNVGAAVRVAAAAGAAGVITTGEHDPWHPSALAGSAGLHFALPVFWARTLNFGSGAGQMQLPVNRPLVAVHPDGETLEPALIPSQAILAFGSERDGLSPGLLAVASSRIAIPMEPGVSSLNLATAVAVVLYAWRLRD